MYLVSTKLSPAHVLDGGCTGLVHLMEIHYSKIDNIIPLINGNGFQVNVTMAHYPTQYLSTLFRCDADRKTKKRLFLSGILQFTNHFVHCSSCPCY